MAPFTSPAMPIVAPSMFQVTPEPAATPHYNLSMAVSTQSFGRLFVPPTAVTVFSKIRSEIIHGKDINLAALLLPSPAIDRQMVDCGEVAVYLKSSDPGLQRNL